MPKLFTIHKQGITYTDLPKLFDGIIKLIVILD